MVDESGATRRLARYITDEGAHIGPGVRDRLHLLLFDYLAIARAGAEKDSARAAFDAIGGARLPHTATSDMPATIEGRNVHARTEDAALANGVASHGLELDDTHEEASLHPGVVIWPAVLALGDELHAPTADAFRAASIGYDVMCAVGTLIGAQEAYGRGFHPTGVAGTVGAAAAAAALFGLDEERAKNAVALAADVAAGSLEFLADGSWTKRLNAGNASAQGVRAARLARSGFVGPDSAIEGRDGMLTQYGQDSSHNRSLHLSVGDGSAQTSVKFYPCCRYMHGNIDLLLALRTDIGGVRASDVERIDVGVIEAGQTLISVPPERKLSVKTPVDAQFNMPFGAALALAKGHVTLADFDDAPRIAEELAEWLPKIHSYTSDRLEAAYPKTWKAEVAITFRDGRSLTRAEDAFTGSPGDPATWSQVAAKATSLLGPAADALGDSVASLDEGVPLHEQLR